MPTVRLSLILQAATAAFDRYMLRRSRCIRGVTRYDMYLAHDRMISDQTSDDGAANLLFCEQAKIEVADLLRSVFLPMTIVALVKERCHYVPQVMTQTLLRSATKDREWDLLRPLAVRYRDRSIDDVCQRWSLDYTIKSRIQLLSIRLRNHSAKIAELGADSVHLQLKLNAPSASLPHLLPAVHAYGAAMTHIALYQDTMEITLVDRFDATVGGGMQIVVFARETAAQSLRSEAVG